VAKKKTVAKKNSQTKSKPMAKKKPVSKKKAKKILSDGTVKGKPLSEKQQGLFGVIASGKKPKKMSKAKKNKKAK